MNCDKDNFFVKIIPTSREKENERWTETHTHTRYEKKRNEKIERKETISFTFIRDYYYLFITQNIIFLNDKFLHNVNVFKMTEHGACNDPRKSFLFVNEQV